MRTTSSLRDCREDLHACVGSPEASAGRTGDTTVSTQDNIEARQARAEQRSSIRVVEPCSCCLMGEEIAVGETVILLHPPLPLAGVSIGMERGCQ